MTVQSVQPHHSLFVHQAKSSEGRANKLVEYSPRSFKDLRHSEHEHQKVIPAVCTAKSLKQKKDHSISPHLQTKGRYEVLCTYTFYLMSFEGLEITLRSRFNVNHEVRLSMWPSQIHPFRIIVDLSPKKSSRIVIIALENDVLSVKFITKVKLTCPIRLFRWWNRGQSEQYAQAKSLQSVEVTGKKGKSIL
jgi:hypothetical protein